MPDRWRSGIPARATTTRSEAWVRQSTSGLRPWCCHDLQFVPDGGRSSSQGIPGQFEHGGGCEAQGSDPPGQQVLLDVNDDLPAVEVRNVNRKTHGQGMHPAAGNDPEGSACGKVLPAGAHQSPEPGPVRVRQPQFCGEVSLPGPVKRIACGMGYRHDCSRVRFFLPNDISVRSLATTCGTTG